MKKLNHPRVAGTIFFNVAKGDKKFLVHEGEQGNQFLVVDVCDGKTGLASIVEEIKDRFNLDASQFELVDLTNIRAKESSMPLFVFEMNHGIELEPDLPNEFQWEELSALKDILATFDLAGVPIFY